MTSIKKEALKLVSEKKVNVENSEVWVKVSLTSRIIRRLLKSHFNGIKFRVKSKSYSMGSSIDVYYDAQKHGVNIAKEVFFLIGHLQQGYFDGMQDMYISSGRKFIFNNIRFRFQCKHLTITGMSTDGNEQYCNQWHIYKK